MKRICVVLFLACISHIIVSSQHSNRTRISHSSKGSKGSDKARTIQVKLPSASNLKALTPQQKIDILYRMAVELTKSQNVLVQTLSLLTTSIASDRRHHRPRRSSARHHSRDHQQENTAQLDRTTHSLAPSAHPAYRRIAQHSTTPPAQNGGPSSAYQHTRSRPYLNSPQR
jgi:hypothetical protein